MLDCNQKMNAFINNYHEIEKQLPKVLVVSNDFWSDLVREWGDRLISSSKIGKNEFRGIEVLLSIDANEDISAPRPRHDILRVDWRTRYYVPSHEYEEGSEIFTCPHCESKSLHEEDKFCSDCGEAVIWYD